MSMGIYKYPWTFINTHGHIYMSHSYIVLTQTAPHTNVMNN